MSIKDIEYHHKLNLIMQACKRPRPPHLNFQFSVPKRFHLLKVRDVSPRKNGRRRSRRTKQGRVGRSGAIDEFGGRCRFLMKCVILEPGSSVRALRKGLCRPRATRLVKC